MNISSYISLSWTSQSPTILSTQPFGMTIPRPPKTYCVARYEQQKDQKDLQPGFQGSGRHVYEDASRTGQQGPRKGCTGALQKCNRRLWAQQGDVGQCYGQRKASLRGASTVTAASAFLTFLRTSASRRLRGSAMRIEQRGSVAPRSSDQREGCAISGRYRGPNRTRFMG